MLSPRAPLVCALLIPLALASAAMAQGTGAAVIAETAPSARPADDQTRFAAIAAEQARKAGESTPDVPSAAERWATAVRRELLTEPSGFYPYFGSVYSGGGVTLGGGYRQFFGDRTHWDVKGLYSGKNYKFLELSTDSWAHSRGRFDAHARFGWRDATQVAYYGLGMTTPSENSEFRMKQTYVGGDMQIRPGGFTTFGLGVTYDDYRLESGAGSKPSIEEMFTSETAPGLGDNPDYVHASFSGGIDWRPSAGYARRGGLYQVTYHSYNDLGATYSFDRVDGEIVQHLPILRETWVVSLHGLVQTTLDDDDVVPYFLMPSLGSGSTLRAYPSWRFRDRHSLLLSGELRWIPNRTALDMALFYDTGKVASQWDGLSLSGMKSNVGIGVRFHGPFTTPLRVELAHGSEGLHLVFAASAAF
jgi:outer membrane protein assembly factor BamA